MQTLSVLNPFRTTDQTILQDTDMAGPLVFCLTLGSFLLLVSEFCIHFSLYHVNGYWNRSVRLDSTRFLFFNRVAKCISHTFTASVCSVALRSMHFWRWWQRKQRWHWVPSFQCWDIVYFQWSYYPASMYSWLYSKCKKQCPCGKCLHIHWLVFVLFLQRNFRHYTCGHLYSVVLNVGVETFCDRILNGSSTDFDRISVCSFVWCICINYNFLNLPSNSVFPIFDQ